jgi:ribonucleotide reductase beta subunit family protein with ferritin-like domain
VPTTLIVATDGVASNNLDIPDRPSEHKIAQSRVMYGRSLNLVHLHLECKPFHSVRHYVLKVYIPYLQMTDPILTVSENRFTTFPIRYNDLWSLYKKAVASFWTAEEIDLAKDIADWNNLSDNDRHFIKMVLAFFASSDGIVMENINKNFGSEVQIAEARSFYAYQEFNEAIHGETYSLMIDKLVQDPIEKENLFRAIETVPIVREKANWAQKWMDKDAPFAQRLAAFMCVEGIFFSGSFCAMFWLKKRGLMPGLCFSNELISRDEGLHLEFAMALYDHLETKTDKVSMIVQEAVAIEKKFITEAIPCKLIGMDSAKMSQYIEYVADRLLKQLGLVPVWNSENPFDWMETISLEGKTNFFEKRVGDYSKHIENNGIRFDEEF